MGSDDYLPLRWESLPTDHHLLKGSGVNLIQDDPAKKASDGDGDVSYRWQSLPSATYATNGTAINVSLGYREIPTAGMRWEETQDQRCERRQREHGTSSNARNGEDHIPPPFLSVASMSAVKDFLIALLNPQKKAPRERSESAGLLPSISNAAKLASFSKR